MDAYDFGDKAVRRRDALAYMPPCGAVPLAHRGKISQRDDSQHRD